MKFKFLIAALTLIGSSLVSAEKMEGVTIENLVIAKDNGAKLFIYTSGVKPVTGCAFNVNYHFVMPLVDDLDKQMYSMLLAAKAARTPVTLEGNGTVDCSVWNGLETLSYISSE